MGVPNLAQHLFGVACDPITPQDMTPFDKVLVQNLPQRGKACNALQPLHDSVKIQFRVRSRSLKGAQFRGAKEVMKA